MPLVWAKASVLRRTLTNSAPSPPGSSAGPCRCWPVLTLTGAAFTPHVITVKLGFGGWMRNQQLIKWRRDAMAQRY